MPRYILGLSSLENLAPPSDKLNIMIIIIMVMIIIMIMIMIMIIIIIMIIIMIINQCWPVIARESRTTLR